MKLEYTIKTFLILVGIGLFICLLALHLSRGQARIAIFGGVLVLTVVWLTADVSFNAARLRSINEALASMGFERSGEIGYIQRLKKGQRDFSIRLAAQGQFNTLPVSIVEYTFVTGSGKSRATHRRMQVSTDGHPQWPLLRIFPRRGFAGRPLSQLFRPAKAGLESESFEKKWEVECPDKDFMVLVLSPDVQAWLAADPGKAEWLFAEGRICLTRRGKCAAEDIRTLVDSLARFVSMVPDELAAWEPGAA